MHFCITGTANYRILLRVYLHFVLCWPDAIYRQMGWTISRLLYGDNTSRVLKRGWQHICRDGTYFCDLRYRYSFKLYFKRMVELTDHKQLSY